MGKSAKQITLMLTVTAFQVCDLCVYASRSKNKAYLKNHLNLQSTPLLQTLIQKKNYLGTFVLI